MFSRIAAFVYGVVCYLAFFATFLYAIGFMGNFGVPKTMDSGRQGPFLEALLINSLLLGVFAVQHSVMARPWFKKAWTKLVPQVVERSTYVLFSSVALLLLFALWQPMGGVIWNVENASARAILYAIYGIGLVTVLVATFLINHFDLFGLRQVWLNLIGRPYESLRFKTPGTVPLRAASAVRRMAAFVLGHPDDDGGAPGVCGCDQFVHLRGDPVRGERSGAGAS